MVLYFVCKLKLVSNKTSKQKIQKNKITLLCYADNDSTAWEMVKEQSRKYMTKKNEKLCDQTLSEGECVREMYVIRESKKNEDKINTIEVYKQWREKGSVWGSTSCELKVAEFSMSAFKNTIECTFCKKNTVVKSEPDLKSIVTVIENLTPKLLNELKNSEMFRERIRQVNKYSHYSSSESSDNL